MRITILTIGSRGDVQPYVALGLGLKAAGHQVCLATETIYQEFVTGQGLDFAPLAGNTQKLFTTESGHTYLESDRNAIHYIRRAIGNLIRPSLEDLLADSWKACQNTEAIISMPLAVGGYHIAEKLGVPYFGAWTCPAIRTRAFPSPSFPAGLRLGGTYNWLTHVLVEQLYWQSIRQVVNQWRQTTLNLPPIPITDHSRYYREKIPTLYAFSPVVVPKPMDWPKWVEITGYWLLKPPSDWQPPAGLVDFLSSGPPPVYIGFGSIIGREPERMTNLVLKAIARSGQRAILDVGWGGLKGMDLPDHIYRVESAAAPHEWLLPQTCGMVHHGGAGTTAAGLRAGIPAVVIPSFGDLFFWGQRVSDLGAGPAPIPRKQLSVERLAAAIRIMTTNETMRTRAAALGRLIRAEDGVTRAVEAFHRYLPPASVLPQPTYLL